MVQFLIFNLDCSLGDPNPRTLTHENREFCSEDTMPYPRLSEKDLLESGPDIKNGSKPVYGF